MKKRCTAVYFCNQTRHSDNWIIEVMFEFNTFLAIDLGLAYFPLINTYSLDYPALCIRVRPRFFDQVGHETMYASSGYKHFFTKSCNHQTYQNY